MHPSDQIVTSQNLNTEGIYEPATIKMTTGEWIRQASNLNMYGLIGLSDNRKVVTVLFIYKGEAQVWYHFQISDNFFYDFCFLVNFSPSFRISEITSIIVIF